MGDNEVAIPEYNRSKLFLLSVIALVTAGMVFSLRSCIIPDLQRVFFDAKDPVNAATLVATVAGIAFLGFAISVLISSPLCDYLGMGRLLGLACLLFVGGNCVIMFASPSWSLVVCKWVLWGGMLGVGLAHGLVEAVINPLIATLYPEDKTHRLNVLHAWWPGGLIMGGLIGYALVKLGEHWTPPFGQIYQWEQAIIFVPALIFGAMLFGTKFPPTERRAAGVSAGLMWKEALKPLFVLWFLCMFLTASSELAPGQWVQEALTTTVHMQGILLLVYISALMFVMRHFAGPLAHKFSPTGLMWISAIVAGIGLFGLSFANSPLTAFVAATFWGTGVCYMWPTMLAVTSERFPKGGALLMGMMGSAGNFSVYLTLPKIGMIYDIYKVKAAEHLGTTFEAVNKLAANDPTKIKVLSTACAFSFRYVALLPAVLIVIFGLIWLRDKARGGYRIEKIDSPDEGWKWYHSASIVVWALIIAAVVRVLTI